eukprot:80506_1
MLIASALCIVVLITRTQSEGTLNPDIIVIESNVSCGDIILNSIDQMQQNQHYYELIIDDIYDVRFDDCFSNTDLRLFIANYSGLYISDLHCPDGDFCGSCAKAGNLIFGENFTIPLMQSGRYYIEIEPFDTGGSYQVQITCTNATNEPITSQPNNAIDTTQSTDDYHIATCGDTLACEGDTYIYLNISHKQYVFFDLCNNQYTDCTDISMTEHSIQKYDRNCRCFVEFNNTSNTMYILHVDPYYKDEKYSLCISCGIKECHNCVDVVTCNATYNGDLSEATNIIYYYFNYSGHNERVMFDSCGSKYDTTLYLYDMDMNVLFEADDDGSCGNRAQMMIHSLSSRAYILGISMYKPDRDRGSADWHIYIYIRVRCGDTVTMNSTVSNAPYIKPDHANNWRDAEEICEQRYESTLATITNERDIQDVINILLDFDHIQFDTWSEHRLWIGMMKYDISDSEWIWIDGTKWNRTSVSMNCTEIDDALNLYYLQDDSRDINQIGVYLYIRINLTTIQHSVSACATDFSTVISYHVSSALCNAPTVRYPIQTCTNGLSCWTPLQCCNDSVLSSDAAAHGEQERWIPPFALWNDTVFIWGFDYIHYARVDLFDNNFKWNHVLYDANASFVPDWMVSQKYAQYQSSLYSTSLPRWLRQRSKPHKR